MYPQSDMSPRIDVVLLIAFAAFAVCNHSSHVGESSSEMYCLSSTTPKKTECVASPKNARKGKVSFGVVHGKLYSPNDRSSKFLKDLPTVILGNDPKKFISTDPKDRCGFLKRVFQILIGDVFANTASLGPSEVEMEILEDETYPAGSEMTVNELVADSNFTQEEVQEMTVKELDIVPKAVDEEEKESDPVPKTTKTRYKASSHLPLRRSKRLAAKAQPRRSQRLAAKARV
jgi:hypothetical protein